MADDGRDAGGIDELLGDAARLLAVAIVVLENDAQRVRLALRTRVDLLEGELDAASRHGTIALLPRSCRAKGHGRGAAARTSGQQEQQQKSLRQRKSGLGSESRRRRRSVE